MPNVYVVPRNAGRAIIGLSLSFVGSARTSDSSRSCRWRRYDCSGRTAEQNMTRLPAGADAGAPGGRHLQVWVHTQPQQLVVSQRSEADSQFVRRIQKIGFIAFCWTSWKTLKSLHLLF